MSEIKKYDYIDAIRGWAIIGVLLIHSYNHFDLDNNELPYWYRIIAESGQKGVQLFFIASAYTLCLSYNSRLDQEVHYLQNYFLRRFFRIAPLFYFMLFFEYFFGTTTPSLRYIVTNVFFLFELHPYGFRGIVPNSWTIGVEMLFYCFFPLLFSFLNNWSKALYFLCVSIVISIGLLVLENKLCNFANKFISIELSSFTFFLEKNILVQFPVFCMGIFLYRLNFKIPESLNAIWFLLLSFLIIAVAILWKSNLSLLLFSLGLLVFFFTLSQVNYQIFVNKISISFGRLSYSIYLCHYIFLRFLLRQHLYHFNIPILLENILRFLLLVIFSYYIAKITYRFVEKRGINFGRKVIEKLNVKYISQ